MLVWVGTDVAGNTLVVWEAEAGPIAQDPIAALGWAGGRISHGERILHTPSPITLFYCRLALSS